MLSRKKSSSTAVPTTTSDSVVDTTEPSTTSLLRQRGNRNTTIPSWTDPSTRRRPVVLGESQEDSNDYGTGDPNATTKRSSQQWSLFPCGGYCRMCQCLYGSCCRCDGSCCSASSIIPWICALAVASSMVSMQWLEDRPLIVSISSISTILITCIVMLQQRKARKLGFLRRQNHELRNTVHYLKQERERFHRALDRLDHIAADLHSVPQELYKRSKVQREDVDRMVDVIQQQRILQEKMREKINQQVLQQIMAVVVQADRDGDWSLRPSEVEALMVRLNNFPSVEFHEQRFRRVVQADPSLTTVMRVIRSLLERDDEYQHPPPIFVITYPSGVEGVEGGK